MFQFLIGRVKRSSFYARSLISNSVSIPYRQSQKPVALSLSQPTISCFNSLQVESKDYLQTTTLIINGSFNSLQVESKERSLCKLPSNYYLFQFLIGRVKRKMEALKARVKARFQFLIGRVKRHFQHSSFRTQYPVSIPYRQSQKDKKKMAVLATAWGFNSLQVESKVCGYDKQNEGVMRFQFLIGRVKSHLCRRWHHQKKSFNSLQVESKVRWKPS